ncbi:MAG: response regulator [Bdellovibrionia bacterium]
MPSAKMNRLYKILVADDDASILRSLALLLAYEGYSVLRAESGNSAIELLRSNLTDLIISDIDMPDGTGLDLMKASRSTQYVPPDVILMSGGNAFSSQQLKEFGVTEFFPKPIDSDKLIATIHKLHEARLLFRFHII